MNEIRLSPLVKAAKCDNGTYSVTFYNETAMGTLEMDVDGY